MNIEENEENEGEKGFYEALGKFERYEQNPFAPETIKRVEKVTTVKKKKTGTTKDAAHYIVNSTSGEIDGYAQFVEYREVDGDLFTKIYFEQFAAFYDLSKPALKVLHYLLSTLAPNSDKLTFRFDKCQEFTGYKGKMSIFSGLGNLIKNGIIARSRYHDEYFINPLILFNGDRVAYTKVYKKKKEVEQIHSDNENRE